MATGQTVLRVVEMEQCIERECATHQKTGATTVQAKVWKLKYV